MDVKLLLQFEPTIKNVPMALFFLWLDNNDERGVRRAPSLALFVNYYIN
ncbi:MAG: hypothetical protein ACJAXJ_002525 [Colwellia sp.]